MQERLTSGDIGGELNIEAQWGEGKKAIRDVQQTVLGGRKHGRKQKWMAEEILDLMKERRKFKNQNNNQYKIIHAEIRRKIRQAKTTGM